MSNVYRTPEASLVGDVVEDSYQPKIFSFSGRIGRLRYLGYCFIVSLLGYVLIIRGTVLMASAMKKAIEAGREAFLAGRMEKKAYASASSPMSGLVK